MKILRKIALKIKWVLNHLLILMKRKSRFCDDCWSHHALTFHLPDLKPESNKEVTFWYCFKHAKPNGFCPGCGCFGAGNESFDFNGSSMCDECTDQFNDDCGLNDEPEYYSDEYGDYEEAYP